MTSAPRSPSIIVQSGPARTRVRSSTLVPASGNVTIVCLCCMYYVLIFCQLGLPFAEPEIVLRQGEPARLVHEQRLLRPRRIIYLPPNRPVRSAARSAAVPPRRRRVDTAAPNHHA